MPFDLHVIRANEFVRLGGSGHVDFKASRKALETLGAACRLRGVDRALMDIRQLRSNLGLKEFEGLINMFREVGFAHGHRLAILHVSEQSQRARAFSFLSALRGWLVRPFVNFEEAVEWLAVDNDHPRRRERAEEIPIKGTIRVSVQSHVTPHPVILRSHNTHHRSHRKAIP